MADNTCSIELSLGDVSLGVSGPQGFVETQFDELYEKHGFDAIDVSEPAIDVSADNSMGSDDAVGGKPQEESEPTVDAALNELLSHSDIKTKQDTTLVVAWYLIAGRGQDDLTISEVREEAERSQVELGEKVPRDLKSNVGKGFLGATGEQREDEDTYEITDTGKEHLKDKGIPA